VFENSKKAFLKKKELKFSSNSEKALYIKKLKETAKIKV